MEKELESKASGAEAAVGIGYRKGALTVVERTSERRYGYVVWRCACDCGGSVLLDTRQLRRIKAPDCGCGRAAGLRDLTGERFGRLVCLGSTRQAGSTSAVWRCRCDCGSECLTSWRQLVNGSKRSCGCLRRETYRENLKLVDGTSVALIENRKRRPIKSNTSGVSGVYYNRKRGAWCTQITFKGKTYYLGIFRDLQDAIKARKRGEEMYDNFLEWYYNQR